MAPDSQAQDDIDIETPSSSSTTLNNSSSSSRSESSNSSKSSVIYNLNPSLPQSTQSSSSSLSHKSSTSSSSSSSATSSSSHKSTGSSYSKIQQSSTSPSSSSYYSSSSNDHERIKKIKRRKYHKHPLIRQNAITLDNDSSSSSDNAGEISTELHNYYKTLYDCRKHGSRADRHRYKKKNMDNIQKIDDLIAQVHDYASIDHQETNTPPPPPSLLSYLSQIASYQLSSDASISNNEMEDDKEKQANNQIYEQFEKSALVAMGILSEEVITEMLLPLANAHVAKCREKLSTATNTMCQEQERYLQELTLDPIEAISELILKQKLNDENMNDNNANDIILKDVGNILPLKNTQKWFHEESCSNDSSMNSEYFQDCENFINVLLASSYDDMNEI